MTMIETLLVRPFAIRIGWGLLHSVWEIAAVALVAAVVGVALLLTRTIRRETSAHKRASARAELERTLAKEASHRIKNDLQTVADLLLLGRNLLGLHRPVALLLR